MKSQERVNSPKAASQRRKWIRRVAIASCAVVVVGAIVIALLPMILSSSLGRSLVVHFATPHVHGQVAIADLSLSWSGPQVIQGLSLTGADGASVVVDVKADNGLVALARQSEGPRITLGGVVTTVYRPDGSLSVAELFVPRATAAPSAQAPVTASPQSATSPSVSLATRLEGLAIEITALSVTATSSEGGRVDALKNLKGKCAVENGGLRAEFSATTQVGEKEGSFAIRGLLEHIFSATGSFDFAEAAVDFDLHATEFALPSTANAFDVPALSVKITSKRLASEVAVDGTTTLRLASGELAKVAIDVQAKSPLEPKESSFSGTIGVDALSTTAFNRWLPAGVVAARDIGPTVNLSVSLDGRSGQVEIASAALQLKVRGELDSTGRLLALRALDVRAVIDPALLPASARPSAATQIAITAEQITIPLGDLQDQTLWKHVQGELDLIVSPIDLNIAATTPGAAAMKHAIGATHLQVKSSDFTSAVSLALTSSIDGAPLAVDQVIRGLVGPNGFALNSAAAKGSITIGSLSLGGAQWLPAAAQTALADLSISTLAARIDVDASMSAGTATASCQLSETALSLKCAWNEQTLATDSIILSATVSPALLSKFAPESVALASPASLTVRVEPLTMKWDDMRAGRSLPAKIDLRVTSPLIEIARAPGLTHGGQLGEFALTATLASRPDGTIGGIASSLNAKILDRGQGAGSLSATFAMSDFAADSWRSSVDLTVGAGETLVQMIDAKAASLMLAGPGRVQGTFHRAGASDAFTAKVALPRLTLDTSGIRSQAAIELAATTATFDVPAALVAKCEGPSLIGSLAIESLRWSGNVDDASVVMSARIEPGSFTLPGRDPIAFEQIKLDISSPRLADHAKGSIAGSFSVGKGAFGALTLAVDAEGNLRTLLGAVDQPLTLAKSHLSIKAPGALILALAQWQRGESAAPLPITQLGDIAADIAIDSLTLPSAAAQSGSMNATIALAPTTITPAGKSRLTLGATTITVAAQRLDAALKASLQGTLQTGDAAPSALKLSVDARGDLRCLFGAVEHVLVLRESTLQLQAPGPLVLALVDWSSGTTDATSALTRMGDVKTTLAIKSLTLPPVGIANAALDATLTLDALDIQPKGKPPVSINATTVSVQTPRLADSLALTITSGGSHGGSITANATALNLVNSAGILDPMVASWTAHAQARGVATALIDAMAGQGGQMVEALGPTLDATVDTKVVTQAAGGHETHIAASVKSQFLDVAAPSVLLSNGHAIVTAANPLRVTFTINPVLQRRLLEPLNPVLADIRSAPPIVLSVSRASYPLDGKLATLDLDARIEVGDVEIVRSNQVLGVMLLAQQGKSETIPAQIQPLIITVRAGQLRYADFIVHAGKLGEQWQQTLKLSGDINLARTPPYANAITCRYPLASLARSVGGASSALSGTMVQLSEAIAALPIDPGELVQADITLSGPLGEVNGKKVPLESKVKLVFDASSINGKHIERGIRDIGGTIDKFKGLFGK